MKVFCGECKFLFQIFSEDLDFIFTCNIKKECISEDIIKDTWLSKGKIIKKYKNENPEILNKNNDCKYYEKGNPIKVVQ